MAVNKRRKKANLQVIIKIAVFIVVIILAALLMFIIKRAADPDNTPNTSNINSSTTQATSGSDNSDSSVNSDTSNTNNTEYATITVDNTQVYTGDLILVNNEHTYTFPSDENSGLVNLYQNKSSDYKAGDTVIKLKSQTVTAMNAMMGAFNTAVGKKDLTIVNGYRTMEQQQAVYDSKVATLGEAKAATAVSKAGASDHHTGLCVDFMIVTSTSVASFSPTGDYGWVAENAFRYGFIQRYPTGKETVTGMNARDGFYRYVGLPHSYLMNTNNQCLDEYIIFIKGYRYDTELLETEFDGVKYKIYYYPSDTGSTTVLPVPSNCESYTYSGNNIDGFIVTAIYK